MLLRYRALRFGVPALLFSLSGWRLSRCHRSLEFVVPRTWEPAPGRLAREKPEAACGAQPQASTERGRVSA